MALPSRKPNSEYLLELVTAYSSGCQPSTKTPQPKRRARAMLPVSTELRVPSGTDSGCGVGGVQPSGMRGCGRLADGVGARSECVGGSARNKPCILSPGRAACRESSRSAIPVSRIRPPRRRLSLNTPHKTRTRHEFCGGVCEIEAFGFRRFACRAHGRAAACVCRVVYILSFGADSLIVCNTLTRGTTD